MPKKKNFEETVSMGVRLTTKQRESLEAIAKNNGVEPAQLIRWAVDALIIHISRCGGRLLLPVDFSESLEVFSKMPSKPVASPDGNQRKAPVKAKRAHLRDVREVSLMILDSIPAGWPVDRDEMKPKRVIKVAKGRFPEGSFGLDVTGDSMNAAKGKFGPILDGETVVLLPPDLREPEHGDIVAALCDGQTTLKRLHCSPNKPCVLHAESTNPEFANDIKPAHELVIQGVVVGKL